MITTWVLVIAIWRSGAVSIPYPDKGQCEAARQVAAAAVSRSAYFGLTFCVPGGGQ